MLVISACIFDLDGVIVDTAKYHYLAWKELANDLGFDFTLEDNEKLKGISRIDSLNILLDIGGLKLDNNEKTLLADKKNNLYLQYISNLKESEILPGVKNFIGFLKKQNIKIALGSASKNAITILNKLNLLNDFDVIIDGNKVEKAKPDPEVFLLAAEKLHVNPINCVVFEDAQSGIYAAKKANMHCIGIGSEDILKDTDAIFPSFEDVTIILKHLHLINS